MHFAAGLPSFYKPCSKNIGLNIWVPMLLQWYECTFGYNARLHQPGYYEFSTLISQVKQNTCTGKPLVGNSPIVQ